MGKKLTKEEFILRANIKHDNTYLYNKVEYTLSTRKVIIVCKEHGDFEQEANSHLRGIGCPSCSGNKKSNNVDFIEKSNIIHNGKYDYSKVEYKGAFSDVIIICEKHGDFLQRPNNHLNSHGCNKCGCEEASMKISKSLEKFIIDAVKIHGNKYDYSLVEYTNAKNKVKIICPVHGIFEQRPGNHLHSECKKCSLDKARVMMTKTKEDFIQDAIRVHQDKYDYSLVEYKGTDIKVKIICKEHGVFIQKCSKHLQNQGCPTCSESKLEKEIRLFLTENKITFRQQYGKKDDYFYLNGQTLDFYLPEYKIAIECQGEQHFRPVDFGNKGKEYSVNCFRKIILRDFKKYSKCKEFGVKIIYYCNKININNEYIDDQFYKLDDILKKIKNHE